MPFSKFPGVISVVINQFLVKYYALKELSDSLMAPIPTEASVNGNITVSNPGQCHSKLNQSRNCKSLQKQNFNLNLSDRPKL